VQRLWFSLALLGFTTFSYADATVIKFQSTITPPIWSPSLPDGGMGGAILRLLSEAAGVPYQIDYLPVKRFQQSTAPYRVGDPDILAVQKPYAILPIMIFRSAFFFYLPHHKRITFHSMEDLKGHTLGVLRGTVADKNYFISQGVKVEENDSIESLLRKLKKGRIDVCILVRIAGLHTIKQLFPQQQKDFGFVPIPNSERPVALIIDPDNIAGKMIADRYRKVLLKTLHSRQYHAILETYYGKNDVPDDWFERLNKFERIYAPETN
jgi:polar amino acid transport system substrate-binding protein